MRNLSRFSVRHCLPFLLVLLNQFLFSSDVQAMADTDGEEEFAYETVFIPAPREITRPIERARSAIAERDYFEAVRQLSFVLNEAAEEDYLIPISNRRGTSSSVIGEAQNVLGTMPTEGLEVYELRFGIEASQQLNEAVLNSDMESVAKISRRYFHTQAGYQATLLLGRFYLDRGKPLAAARFFHRIIETPAARKRYDPEASLLYAVCMWFGNRTDRSVEILNDLQQRMPSAKFVSKGREIAIFDPGSDPLTWLGALIGPAGSAQGIAEPNWVMHRGDTSRNARSDDGVPLLNPRWQVHTIIDLDDEETVIDRQKSYQDQEVPAIPSLHALAVKDYVLMRTPNQLVGIDFQTGKRVWVYPWDRNDVDSLFLDSASSPVMNQESNETLLKQRLWEDASFGQFSSDGKLVFLIDEGAYVAPQDNGAPFGMRMIPRGAVALQERTNQLVGLKLVDESGRRVEGKMAWIIGGDDGIDEPKLAGAYFLGTPLPSDDQLYVMVEIKGEIRLVVLDSKSGALIWSQQLASVERAQTVQEDSMRRMAGATPSLSEDVLVCPTSAGAIVGVDLSTRSLMWGFEYEKEAKPRRGAASLSAYGGDSRDVGGRWADSSVTVVDGRVILTPVESEQAYCLDLMTGEALWDEPLEREEMIYLATVQDGRMILVGKSEVRAVDLKNASVAWKLALDDYGIPSGRGYASDGHFYLPTYNSLLVKIDLETGQVQRTVETERVLGNLITYRGHVVSHGIDFVAAYRLDEFSRRLVEHSLARKPDDPVALALKGQLLLHDGNWKEAFEILRHSASLEPREETQQLMIASLMRAMKLDFGASWEFIVAYEDMLLESPEREQFLMLKIQGLIASNRSDLAFDNLLELADLQRHDPGSKRSFRELDGEGLSLREDRWFQTTLDQILDNISAEKLNQIEARLAQRLAAAVTADSQEELFRFVYLFGQTRIAQQAALELAIRMARRGELIMSELMLGSLLSQGESELRPRALGALASVSEQAGELQATHKILREVSDDYGDDIILDDRTGRELLNDFTRRHVDQSLAVGPHDWPYGAVIPRPSGDNGYALLQRYTQSFSMVLIDDQSSIPRAPWEMVYNSTNKSIYVRDQNGQTITRVDLKQTDGSSAYYNNMTNDTFYKIRDHLMVAHIGHDLFGINLLGSGDEDDDQIIWRTSLLPESSSVRLTPYRRASPRVQRLSKWGVVKVFLNDSDQKLLGASGAISPNGFCYINRNRLECIDPITGNLLWKRSVVVRGSDCLGDDEEICVVPPGSETGVVYRVFDGKKLRDVDVPYFDNRWLCSGTKYVAWREEAGMVLFRYDVKRGEKIWETRFADQCKVSLIGNEEIAVLEPDGVLRVISVEDGSELVAGKIDDDESVQSIQVIKYDGNYLVATNRNRVDTRTAKSNMDPASQIETAPMSWQVPLIEGRIYALHGKTGEWLWQKPAYIDQFAMPMPQPQNLPVLTFLRHVSKNSKPGDIRTEILCIDKRDGRVLLQDNSMNSKLYRYQVVGAPEADRITIETPNQSFTLQFTDQPVPPSPTAQTGLGSSGKALGNGKSISRVLNGIRRAFE